MNEIIETIRTAGREAGLEVDNDLAVDILCAFCNNRFDEFDLMALDALSRQYVNTVLNNHPF